ncbi:MAG: leucine-rich repeat protein [Bacteroidales bacterium]|nr:leucine-rich repeat protein [Bacteroidales bacterium]
MRTVAKFITIVVCITFICFDISAKGFDFRVKTPTGSYIYYKILSILNKTVEVSFNNRKPSSYEGFIDIPDTVVYKDVSYTVVSIGDSAFYNCYELNGVRIPPTVERIGESAFDASRLRNVELSEGLKTIEDFAFRQCSQIQEINLPNTLERIGKGAFIFCSNIRNLVIPKNVREIGVSAFYNCEKVYSLTIPLNLELLGENAFYGCENLQEVFIEAKNCNLTNNFSHRNSIKKIHVLPSVNSISDGAFSYNTDLSEVEWLSEKCSYLGNSSIFEECPKLTTISIGNGVEEIPNYFAKQCNGLSEITIPESVRKIGKEAFAYCSNLTNLYFNAKACEYNGANSFVNDSALTNVVIGKNVKQLPDGFVRGCLNLTEINIPDNVIRVGELAFKDCKNLKTITLRENIEYIGRNAFEGCLSLESVTCKTTKAPQVNGSLGWNDNVKIYIPCSYIYYYNSADFWKEQRFECDTTVAVATKSESGDYDIVSQKNGEIFYYKISSKSRRTISLVKYFSDGTIDEILVPTSVAWEGGTYSVTSISGNKVFEDVYTDIIDIPASVTNISIDAFLGIKSLKYINIDENNKAYCSENGVLYNKDKSILLCHPTSSSAVFNVPSTVVSIESNAFGVARDANLKSIRIPAGVISIGDNAFSACVGLKDINIDVQNNAYMVENGVLYDKKKTCIIAVCPAYFMNNEFTITKSIKTIVSGAFRNWENLSTVNVLAITPPNIGENVFNSNDNLTIVVPRNSYTKYKNSNNWKDYPNLKYQGMKSSPRK